MILMLFPAIGGSLPLSQTFLNNFRSVSSCRPSYSNRVKTEIFIPPKKISYLKSVLPERSVDMLRLSGNEVTNLLATLGISKDFEITCKEVQAKTPNWEWHNINRCDFSIQGNKLTFSPKAPNIIANNNLINLVIVFSALLRTDVFNGEKHQFSAVLMGYSDFGTDDRFTGRFHNDSYLNSCILDISGAKHSYTNLLFTLDKIAFELPGRGSDELLVFPQKKECSIKSLGVDLSELDRIYYKDACGSERTAFKGSVQFQHLVRFLEINSSKSGIVLHQAEGEPHRVILNVCEELPGNGWEK